jgi:micrococcal nuclease
MALMVGVLRKTLVSLVIALWAFCHPKSFADDISTPPEKHLKKCGQQAVIAVFSGDKVKLADGTIVSLADTKAPELWPDDSDYNSWPYAFQSKFALSRLVLNKAVALFCSKKSQTLMGELSAHLILETGVWVQQEMLTSGHAFYFAQVKSNLPHEGLLKFEQEARQQKRGLWSYTGYRFQKASVDENKNIRPGWFQFIEGRVLSAKRNNNRVFLNFGPDWSKDFTIEVPLKFARKLRFSKTPEALEQKNIRVRGWVEWAGGPKIILTSASHLQIAEEP